MTKFFVNEETSVAGQVLNATAQFFRNRAARRAQRIALGQLLAMSPERLDDLGLDYQDVVEALNAPPPAGPRLEQRREVRAGGFGAVAAN